MPFIDLVKMETLKEHWTDKYVQVRAEHPELQRFVGKVGRVVTVNYSGKAIIDFADGAWYDIPASETYLEVVSAEQAQSKYDNQVNSAQAHPQRQA